LPKSYTGKIRTRKLIAQLIYYNLNRWQIRNDIKHSMDSGIEYKKLRENYKMTIAALYARNENLNNSLSPKLLNKLIALPNDRRRNWLLSHEASTAYKAYAHQEPAPTRIETIQNNG